jgi:O-antigen ligase
VQLGLIVLAKMDGRTLKTTLKSAAIVITVVTAAVAAVTFYKPLHDRFFTGDVVTIWGFRINVSGRLGLWAPNWDAFKKDWLFGNGAGTSDRITAALPHHGATQPHCDYLRLLVDYGLVGALVWLAAMIGLLLGAWYAWRPLRGTRSMGEHIHAAAFLGIVGMMGGMLVDNPLIEFSKMASLGALVGVSIALQQVAAHERAKAAEPATAFPLLDEVGAT